MLYSRVVALKVGDELGQKGGQLGNGAGAAVGICDVPKYWPPSTRNPSQGVRFAPREASHPGSPAQWPALKKPDSAYEPPAKSSTRGNSGAGAAAGVVEVGIVVGSGGGAVAGAGAGVCAGAGAGVCAGVGACAHDITHCAATTTKTPRYFLTIPP